MKKNAAKNDESPTELIDARIEALGAWRGAAAKLNTSKGQTPTCPIYGKAMFLLANNLTARTVTR